MRVQWCFSVALSLGASFAQAQSGAGSGLSVGQVSPSGQGGTQNGLGGISHVTRQTRSVVPQIIARDFFSSGGVTLNTASGGVTANGVGAGIATATALAVPNQNRVNATPNGPVHQLSPAQLSALAEAAKGGDTSAREKLLELTGKTAGKPVNGPSDKNQPAIGRRKPLSNPSTATGKAGR